MDSPQVINSTAEILDEWNDDKFILNIDILGRYSFKCSLKTRNDSEFSYVFVMRYCSKITAS